MDSVAALLIVVYQFFFGWCSAESAPAHAATSAQAATPAQAAATR
jgi:hypothetical protein